jgi:hypothetical protein
MIKNDGIPIILYSKPTVNLFSDNSAHAKAF